MPKKTTSSLSSRAPKKTEKKFSIYDEDGNVSEDAERIMDEVFPDYPVSSKRMAVVRKTIWDTLQDDNWDEKDFIELCQNTREFVLEKEGSMAASQDPKTCLLTAWIELFRAEIDPIPKEKTAQAEWKAMYGNLFWVTGWALMQLKEEDKDLSWTNWHQLTGGELIELASDFANYVYSEDLEPLLATIE